MTPAMATRYELAPCPVCAGTIAAEVASEAAIRDELESLWSFHTRRLRPDTPPRHFNDRVVFSQQPPLRLAQCATCSTVYRNPRERPRTVTELYREEPVDTSVLHSLYETQRAVYRAQARRLTRVAGRPGTGLEIGSYVGGFLSASARLGWQFEGRDVNEGANRFARDRGFTVTRGTLEDCDGAGTYDAVAIWNCFDQLPEPRAAVRDAARLLRSGGVLAIRVPNGAFYAWLKRRSNGRTRRVARALLAHNNLLAFPYLHGFTPRSLSRLLEDAGLRVVRVRGDTLVPVADRWTRTWAAWEERMLKGALHGIARGPRAPWFEVYART
jgi:2-polyprenyl-3-methyl-5-hydroxy-6-metoxy-1,4-benzoquinol methylase